MSFVYFRERQSETEVEQKQWHLAFTGSPKWPCQLGLVQVKTLSRELHHEPSGGHRCIGTFSAAFPEYISGAFGVGNCVMQVTQTIALIGSLTVPVPVLAILFFFFSYVLL